MKKNTQIILGLGALALAAYFLMKPKKSFSGGVGSPRMRNFSPRNMPKDTGDTTYGYSEPKGQYGGSGYGSEPGQYDGYGYGIGQYQDGSYGQSYGAYQTKYQ